MTLDAALAARFEALAGRISVLVACSVDADAGVLADLRRLEQGGPLLRRELARLAGLADVAPRQVAHDLRNPLTAVLGYAELLMEESAERLAEGVADELAAIHADAAALLEAIGSPATG